MNQDLDISSTIKKYKKKRPHTKVNQYDKELNRAMFTTSKDGYSSDVEEKVTKPKLRTTPQKMTIADKNRESQIRASSKDQLECSFGYMNMPLQHHKKPPRPQNNGSKLSQMLVNCTKNERDSSSTPNDEIEDVPVPMQPPKPIKKVTKRKPAKVKKQNKRILEKV